ncbi:MAG: PA2169 family four-helix-bundle protein [Myxococcota bacterium]
METKTDLRDETVEKLQNLIQLNIDSKEGFTAASEKVNDDTISSVFRRLASERDDNIRTLKNYVSLNNEQPKKSGTIKGSAHRMWMGARAAINKGDPHVILVEAEKGEDEIKHAYEDVLRDIPGSALNDVLLGQFRKVKVGHDHVRALRDNRAH